MKPFQYLALFVLTLGAGLFTIVRFQHQAQTQSQQTVVLLPYAAGNYQGEAYKANLVHIKVFARIVEGKKQSRVLIGDLQPQALKKIQGLPASVPTYLQLPSLNAKASVIIETELSYNSEGTVLTIVKESAVSTNQLVTEIPLAV